MARNTFSKDERLKSRKAIAGLFKSGRGIKRYPLAVRYLPGHQPDGINRAGFSVSKKKFKTAVQRNLLKRRMREAYRLHKQSLATSPRGLSMMFVYIAKEEFSYEQIESAMVEILRELSNQS